MLNGTLALLERSLREDSRSIRQHVLRFALAGFVLFNLWIAQQTAAFIGAPGRYFFLQLVYSEMFFIAIIAANYFAVAVTEEKEERTLGLMRMADIGPLSLVLGKLIPRLWVILLLLIMQLPFTLLAVTMGGLTVRQVVAARVAIMAFTVLLAGIALFCSVVARRSNQACWATALLTVGWVFGPFIVGGFMENALGMRSTPLLQSMQFFQENSVAARLNEVLALTFDGAMFSRQTVVDCSVGAIFLVLAWACFEAFASDDATQGKAESSFQIRSLRRTSRAWSNPFAWKDFVFLAGGWNRFVLRMILYPFVIFGLCYLVGLDSFSVLDPSDAGSALIIGSLWAGFFEFGSLAGNLLREEVRWKTLEGLYLLPLSASRIMYSKLLGYLGALVPAGIYLVVGSMMQPEDTQEFLGEIFTDGDAFFTLASLVTLFAFYLHLGAYLSLYLKWGALAAAFIAVFLSLLILMPMVFQAMGPSDFEPIAVLFCIAAWFMIAIMHRLMANKLAELSARS